MELTTKTAKRLKNLKDYGYDIVFNDEYRRIISMKDELKDILKQPFEAVILNDIYNLVQEIEQVQNEK